MDKKAKKRMDVLSRKLSALRKQLAGARRQTDEPEEVERLAEEVTVIEAEMKRLKEG